MRGKFVAFIARIRIILSESDNGSCHVLPRLSLRIKYLSPLRTLLIITYFFSPTNRREISTRNPLIFQPTYVSRIYQSIDRIKTFNPIYLLIAIRSNDQSSLIKEQTESTVL